MSHSRFLWSLPFVAVSMGLAGGPALALTADCFDAEVSATITRETPTVARGCGDDCIIMSWPWIVELQVRRVFNGELKRGPLTVLTVQHTDHRRGLGERRWKLRRNTLGTFNVLQSEDGTFRRCPAYAQPASPFIQPADGQTLDDLRREGEAYYGRRTDG